VYFMKIFDWLEDHIKFIKLISVPLILLLITLIALMVHLTEGHWLHLMYIPVILGGIIYGSWGGLISGVIGSIAISPLIHSHIDAQGLKAFTGWIEHAGSFSFIGLFIGAFAGNARKYMLRTKWEAVHDKITGLPNRLSLEKEVENLSAAEKAGKHHYMIIAIVKNSRELESAFGPEVVNNMIGQLADRLSTVSKEPIKVYRTHFDQVGILVKNYHENKIEEFLKKIESRFYDAFEFEDIRLHGDIFMGIFKFDKINNISSYYLQKASSAAVKAIKSNKRYFIMTMSEALQTSDENLKLMGDIKEALDKGQIYFHFQPKINLSTGRLHGFEAFMRWDHPVYGYIPPGKFIPRAEESTLIHWLTFYTIDKGLAQLLRWNDKGIKDIRLAVNISTQNLADPDFTKKVIHLLDRYGIDGKYLELEITENSFMADIDKEISALNSLSDAGIILSIDDFGTGYSSLLYLKQLPVSAVKIDQAFVKHLPEDNDSVHIVREAIRLAHILDMEVVAEGVETQESLEFLKQEKCDLAQGYYICRPLPAAEIEEIYNKTNGKFVE